MNTPLKYIDKRINDKANPDVFKYLQMYVMNSEDYDFVLDYIKNIATTITQRYFDIFLNNIYNFCILYFDNFNKVIDKIDVLKDIFNDIFKDTKVVLSLKTHKITDFLFTTPLICLMEIYLTYKNYIEIGSYFYLINNYVFFTDNFIKNKSIVECINFNLPSNFIHMKDFNSNIMYANNNITYEHKKYSYCIDYILKAIYFNKPPLNVIKNIVENLHIHYKGFNVNEILYLCIYYHYDNSIIYDIINNGLEIDLTCLEIACYVKNKILVEYLLNKKISPSHKCFKNYIDGINGFTINNNCSYNYRNDYNSIYSNYNRNNNFSVRNNNYIYVNNNDDDDDDDDDNNNDNNDDDENISINVNNKNNKDRKNILNLLYNYGYNYTFKDFLYALLNRIDIKKYVHEKIDTKQYVKFKMENPQISRYNISDIANLDYTIECLELECLIPNNITNIKKIISVHKLIPNDTCLNNAFSVSNNKNTIEYILKINPTLKVSVENIITATKKINDKNVKFAVEKFREHTT
jgi:hypothetical protein